MGEFWSASKSIGLQPLPEVFDENLTIEYRLYTRNNTNNSILLDDTAQPVNRTQEVDLSNAPIKIIIHGWQSSAGGSEDTVKSAYLRKSNLNIICIDWSTITCSGYFRSVRMVKAVAVKIARFIDAASDRYGVVGGFVHLIGHSLGAHVAGIAASQTKLAINRVTGLDPARPLFEVPKLRPASERIDPSDADFVDIIHTCGGKLGFEGLVGHADFYPNGGSFQPGCGGDFISSAICAHTRAWLYFMDSILHPSKYESFRCDSWQDYLSDNCEPEPCTMGDNVDQTVRGVFYLEVFSQK